MPRSNLGLILLLTRCHKGDILASIYFDMVSKFSIHSLLNNLDAALALSHTFSTIPHFHYPLYLNQWEKLFGVAFFVRRGHQIVIAIGP